MKILIVDDDNEKSDTIAAAIDETLGDSVRKSITSVRTLADAVRVPATVQFDLVVLDLMLPYLAGGPADSRSGLELLRQLRSKEGPNQATVVIGISAFPDEIDASRGAFEEYGVLVSRFDDEGSWRVTLSRVVDDLSKRVATKIELDFLVICALEEERAAFRHTSFEKVSEAIVSGLNVEYVRLAAPWEQFGAVVRLGQMGLVAATFETTSALDIFRTKVLAMSGICAGFSKQVSLGQLVIASPAWEYQAGKWSPNGFEIAPVQVPIKRTTRSVIDQLIADDSFVSSLEVVLKHGETRPTRQMKAVLAPFATGSAVVADPLRLTHVAMQHRKVAALDMETFGVYFVAQEAVSTVEHFFL